MHHDIIVCNMDSGENKKANLSLAEGIIIHRS